MPDQNQTDPNTQNLPIEPDVTPPPVPLDMPPLVEEPKENIEPEVKEETPVFIGNGHDSPPPPPIIEMDNPTVDEMNKKEEPQDEMTAPSNSMPKKKSKGLITGIIAGVLLIAGLGAGVILVRQQQDIRERAANCDVPVSACGSLTCPSGCTKYQEAVGICGCRASSTPTPTPTLTPTMTTRPTPTLTPTLTPTSTPTPPISCVAIGQRCGSTERCCNGGSCTNNVCRIVSTPTPDPVVLCTTGKTCTNVNNSSNCSSQSGSWQKCDNSGGTCCVPSATITTSACPYNFSGGGQIIAGSCTGTCPSGEWAKSYCKGKNVNTQFGCQDGMVIVKRTTPPSFDASFCGVQQIDCSGNYQIAFQSRKDITGCGTDGGGGDTYACLAVKAYDTNWTAISAAGLKLLKAGDKIRLTVAGTTSTGTFNKAKFKINGSETAEVTAVKPNTTEFYYEYTIPANVFTFTVDAKINHSTAGWSL
jgi:hypothetical protein